MRRGVGAASRGRSICKLRRDERWAYLVRALRRRTPDERRVRIAAECAVETGGNPIGWAGCTAGTLTVRELTKCFSGEIGKDCYGENNSFRKTLEDGFADITRGPGENNDIVKAIGDIGRITGGPNSIVNKPEQFLGGPHSILHNPGQIAGGPNSFVNQVLHPPNLSLPPIFIGGAPVTVGLGPLNPSLGTAKADLNPLHPSATIAGKTVTVNPDPTKLQVNVAGVCLGWGCAR
jgi:hypothetical protein